MARRPRNPKSIHWRLTHKVREALRSGRYVVSDHIERKLDELALSREEFLAAVAAGVVLSRRERDEARTAVDGYKHFLETVTPSGGIIEVVLKFVRSEPWSVEELIILITAYRGRA